jgi:hypothetical protein
MECPPRPGGLALLPTSKEPTAHGARRELELKCEVGLSSRGRGQRGRSLTSNQKGAGQKKIGDPRGGWVGQSTKKGWGQIYLFDIFYRVF